MKNTFFLKRFQKKSNEELTRIIVNQDSYTKEAVSAASEILKERQVKIKGEQTKNHNHGQNKSVLNIKENKNILTISRGAQFRNGSAKFPFLMLLILLSASLYSLSEKNFNAFFVLLPIFVLMLFIVLDIRGVQVDQKNNKIRKYWMNYWMKFGKWVDFNSYQSIYLNYSTYTISTFTFYTALTTFKPKLSGNVTNGHYVVAFVNLENKDSIIVAEKSSYKEAIKAAEQISKKFNIEFHDIYRQKVKRIKKSRRR